MSKANFKISTNKYEDYFLPFYLGSFVVIGLLMRKIHNPLYRNYLNIIIGLFSIFIASGCSFMLQQISLAFFNFLLLKLTPKNFCHVLTFISSFSYLFYLRISYLFNEDFYFSITDCAMLFLVFRYVSVAFDVYQSNVSSENNTKFLKRVHGSTETLNVVIYSPLSPFFTTYMGYIFSFNGLYTGPFFRYSVYVDSLTLYKNNEYLKSLVKSKIPVGYYLPSLKDILKSNSTTFAICLAIYCTLNYILPDINQIDNSFFEYKNKPFHQIIFMMLLFLRFRVRLMGAFIFSDVSLKCMGIGAYPTQMKSLPGHGPSQFMPENSKIENIDFLTIKNVDYYNVEMGTSMRSIIRNWNICIQWWLASYVYQVFPLKFARTYVVFFVSSFWHGVKPGHYLCIMNAAIYLTVEWIVDKCISSHIKSRSVNSKFFKIVEKVYYFYTRFMAYRALEYFGVSILVMSWSSTNLAWKPVNYYIHIYMFLWLVVGFILIPLFSFIAKNRLKDIKKL